MRISKSTLYHFCNNGVYAFELMSKQSLDTVVCGLCGTIGQVYYGDGNGKNCCSIEKVPVFFIFDFLSYTEKVFKQIELLVSKYAL